MTAAWPGLSSGLTMEGGWAAATFVVVSAPRGGRVGAPDLSSSGDFAVAALEGGLPDP